MKKNLYPVKLLFPALLFAASASHAQVSGNVFRDLNNDGIKQNSNPAEPWEYGMTVKAYSSANVLVATTVTNNAGHYGFSAAQLPSGMAVRIEFQLLTDDQPSHRMGSNNSNIQFVTAGGGANNVDFAVTSKKYYTNNPNPFVATTAYVNGDANATGGVSSPGDKDNLLVFPYDLSNPSSSTNRAANKYTGSVFGLAWQKESRTLLMSAYLKRHCGFGPGGIGAIYETQIDNTGAPTAPALLLNVNTLGINVGADPRTDALPTDSRTPNTDVGVFSEIGKRGIGGIEISVDGRDLYIINMYEKKLHRINIGNPVKSSFSSADVTGTWTIPDPSSVIGHQWHPMAIKMYSGKLYIGGVCVKETTGLQSLADAVGQKAVVYQFDPSTAVFTKVLEFPLTYRKGYSNNDYKYEFRNNYWSAWQNNGDISYTGPLRTGLVYNPAFPATAWATALYYAQPMFSAIEFDTDGSMILAIRDRFGDQGGYANYFETGNVAGETYRTLASGEVLRAGKNGATWNLESGGSVTNNGVTTASPGLADNNELLTGSFAGATGTPWGGIYGPGGGYFYYNFNYTLTGVPSPYDAVAINRSHYLKSNGGLALLPGYNEVITSAIDPMNVAYSNGIIKNTNSGAQAGNMSGRMNLIVSASGDPTYMGKAASLGDVEILTDAAAMEIGNRVWLDGNYNGRQDAHEPGIAGVTVILRSPGLNGTYNNADDQTWTVVTDANGNYYFDNTIVNDNRRPASWIGVSATNSGILPGFEYKVEINTAQVSLTGLLSTGSDWTNDEIDSDGSSSGGKVTYVINPGGTSSSSSTFNNNYNVDFGFYVFVLSEQKLNVNATLADNSTKVQWKTTGEENVVKYNVERSVNGSSFTTVATVASKGNGSFTYDMTDDISAVTASTIYYRIKAEDKSGFVKYSEVVNVKRNASVKLSVSPNPVVNTLNVQFTSSQKKTVQLQILNASGQAVYHSMKTVDKGVNSFMLNEFTHLPKGMYMIVVKTNEFTEQQRVIK